MVNASVWASASQDQFKSIVLEWAIPKEKIKPAGELGMSRGHNFFLKTLELFWVFFCVSLDISDITKLDPLKFGKIVYLCYIPRKFPGKTQNNFTRFFLIYWGYSKLLLINSWKFCMLYLEYPWKFYIINRLPHCPVCVFLQNSLMLKTLCQFTPL